MADRRGADASLADLDRELGRVKERGDVLAVEMDDGVAMHAVLANGAAAAANLRVVDSSSGLNRKKNVPSRGRFDGASPPTPSPHHIDNNVAFADSARKQQLQLSVVRIPRTVLYIPATTHGPSIVQILASTAFLVLTAEIVGRVAPAVQARSQAFTCAVHPTVR